MGRPDQLEFRRLKYPTRLIKDESRRQDKLTTVRAAWVELNPRMPTLFTFWAAVKPCKQARPLPLTGKVPIGPVISVFSLNLLLVLDALFHGRVSGGAAEAQHRSKDKRITRNV